MAICRASSLNSDYCFTKKNLCSIFADSGRDNQVDPTHHLKGNLKQTKGSSSRRQQKAAKGHNKLLRIPSNTKWAIVYQGVRKNKANLKPTSGEAEKQFGKQVAHSDRKPFWSNYEGQSVVQLIEHLASIRYYTLVAYQISELSHTSK